MEPCPYGSGAGIYSLFCRCKMPAQKQHEDTTQAQAVQCYRNNRGGTDSPQLLNSGSG